MPRLKRRTKVITIRLSPEEYAQLQRMAEQGSCTISELTRAAVQSLAGQHGNGSPPVEARVNEIHARVSHLDREVARLSALMGVTRPDKTH